MVDIHDDRLTSVQRAFSKQAAYYDQHDSSNPILKEWRQKVYAHVDQFLKPGSKILELNAGTGIDALHFVHAGHTVVATDFSPGMVAELQKKAALRASPDKFRVRQCSFEALGDGIHEKFDYVFSNFGGLNCSADLTQVVSQLRGLLNEGAFVTWVIMPPVCPWEIAGLLAGNKNSLRRLKRGGATARLEGEEFQTYYYSLDAVKETFTSGFHFVKAEGLGAMSPPPSSVSFVQKHPWIYSIMRKIDAVITRTFPFNRWADHIVVTFQYRHAT